MAGTDTLIPFLVPGFALHHELEELVAVGTQLIVELVKRLCDELPVVVSVTESGIG